MLGILTWRVRGALIGLLVAGIVACAARSPEPEPPSLSAARKLEDRSDAQAVGTSPEKAVTDLHQALHLYSLVDDREGQVRCYLKLTRIYIGLGQTDNAQLHLARANAIAETLQVPVYLYDSYFLEARLTGQKTSFETALSWAETPIQRAVVLTYLSRVDEAYRLIEPVMGQAEDAPDDFAFVLYEYARIRRNAGAAQGALVLFKKIDHHRGICNSLHLLAQIYKANGKLELAQQYYERALTVSISLDDPVKTQAIEAELSRF